jgi:excinuclease ABC subunit B
MYADTVTDSMRQCLTETERRRAIQAAYNAEHGITPTSIVKAIDEVMSSLEERDYLGVPDPAANRPRFRTAGERAAYLTDLDRQMKHAAANLDFEKAAALRDEIKAVRVADLGLTTVAAEH